MKSEKFIELRKAKSLAVLITATTIILYITKGLFLASEILMIFLGLSALIKTKINRTKLNEKKSEIKKGFYFSVSAVIFGFLIEKFFELNFIIESILFALIFAVIKEIYSEKKEKWINAFVLTGSILIFSGTILLIKLDLMKFI